jgi:selenocysteine-specific elongation factor
MEKGSERDLLIKTIETREPAEFRDIVNRANLEPEIAKKELEAMASEGLAMVLGQRIVGPGVFVYTASGWTGVRERASRFLAAFHGQYPLRPGLSKEEFRSRLGMNPQIFGHALPRLQGDGVVVEEGSVVRSPEHMPSLTPEQQRIADGFVESLSKDPYSPPTDALPDSDVLNLIVQQGKVVKVSETVVFSASAYEDMVNKISAHIRENGEISLADVRDLFGTSRKYAMALVDYLDQQRITRRVGDARVLR